MPTRTRRRGGPPCETATDKRLFRCPDPTRSSSTGVNGPAGRPSLHRKHPIPALLMKRSVREPEKV
jgi:hypothetical protein